MNLNRVGIVGARGMVGSVLLQRMIEENDFSIISEPVFFSTSQAGQSAPDIGRPVAPLADANDINALSQMQVIITCQGGDYTNAVYPKLRANGWQGYWIDAASSLRMSDDAIIVLDPLNKTVIENGLKNGIRDYIGGNCTVSLMMLALNGLFSRDLIDWITVSSYQAISGSGANAMRELLLQMGVLSGKIDHSTVMQESILDIDRRITDAMQADSLPKSTIGYALAGSLLPWIDSDLENGMSREEKKGFTESNKILGRHDNLIPIDSICVRVGAMRSHSQALTIALKQDLPLDEINQILDEANDWVKLINNTKTETLAALTPAAVTGTLSIPIGRVRKLSVGKGMISAFTVGDQLLWGAAEPLRRMLRILHESA